MQATQINLAEEPPLRVGTVVLDPPARTVIGPEGASERLEPRVMQVFVHLAKARGVVGREELIDCCWSGQIVGDDSINRVISRLRRVAAEHGDAFSIETIPRVGYKLIAEISPVLAPEPSPVPGVAAPVPALTLLRAGDARRRKFWVRWALAGTMVSVAMGGLAVEAVRARSEARARRGDAEQLVEFMLGDLRKRLDAVGRLDVLDSVGAQTMAYYARQDVGSLSADELARRAKALRLVGELRAQRGFFGPAVTAFEQAAATTGELMAREPNNGQRVFDHAQSVFALGSLFIRKGDAGEAKKALDEYARLADRLVAINPARDDWQAEFAYSRHNRGTVELKNGDLDDADRDFAGAAEVMNGLRVRYRSNVEYKEGFAQANAWRADVLRAKGEINRAIMLRVSEAAVYREQLASDPNNMGALQSLSWAERAMGVLELEAGRLSDADGHLQAARSLIEQQTRIERGNVLTMERAVAIFCDLATVQALRGDRARATDTIETARRIAIDLQTRDGSVMLWRELRAEVDVVRSELALLAGDRAMAKWLATDAGEALDRSGVWSAQSETPLWSARAHLVAARVDAPAAPEHWRKVIAALAPRRSNIGWQRCALEVAMLKSSSEVAGGSPKSTLAGVARPACNANGFF